jgi:hypothetical protein
MGTIFWCWVCWSSAPALAFLTGDKVARARCLEVTMAISRGDDGSDKEDKGSADEHRDNRILGKVQYNTRFFGLCFLFYDVGFSHKSSGVLRGVYSRS